MKIISTVLFTAIVLGITAMTLRVNTATLSKSKRGNVVHMVSFKFKDSASKEDIRKIEFSFTALTKTIPQILSFEWGTNVSPEGHDKGFTHGFVLTFDSQRTRDEYLIHPDHKEFGSLVGPLLEDVFVVDFVNQFQNRPE